MGMLVMLAVLIPSESSPAQELSKFPVHAVTGDQAGQVIDLSTRSADSTVVLVYLSAKNWARPVARYVKKLDEALVAGIDGIAKPEIVVVWLSDDAAKGREYLPKAQMSLQLQRTLWTVYEGDQAGPQGWQVDTADTLTTVLVQRQKTAGKFGYRVVNETNVDEALKALKELGKPTPERTGSNDPPKVNGEQIAANTASDWTQWRGPHGQGHAMTARGLPLKWSEQENIRWKTELPGRGWSSPVIVGARIWLTAAIETKLTEEQRKERVKGIQGGDTLSASGPVTFRAICVARDSGKILQDVELLVASQPDPIHALNSYASPSPIWEQDRLFCHFGSNGTVCLDTQTGKVLWTNREHQIKHENGAGSTPVLWRDKLIFHCDGSDQQYIVALDKETGKTAWRTSRTGAMNANPQFKKAYGTPLVLDLDGKSVVLSTGADWLYGYDPSTGQELWKLSYGVLGFSIVPRPVYADGILYISTSFMQPEILAVKLGNGQATPEISWRQKKGAPQMSSPLLVQRELYLVNDKGVATCLDARSGDSHWSERLGGNFSSSPLWADGHIFMGNREGQMFVIEPGTTFQLKATNTLNGAIMASPIALDRALYVRTDKALYRIESP
jgi:outer membrane protein assembly factor BamB